MGHIWVIYGLYMGYPRELAIVAPSHGLYIMPYLLPVGNEGTLYRLWIL
jgi:hypothetical protein